MFWFDRIKVIQLEQDQFEKWELTEEGAEIVEKGSHEARVFNAIEAEKGSLQADIMASEC